MPRLTSKEIEELLRRQGLVRVATTGEHGFPTLVPVAFLYRDRQILLTALEVATRHDDGRPFRTGVLQV